jgi:hypothetical protein
MYAPLVLSEVVRTLSTSMYAPPRFCTHLTQRDCNCKSVVITAGGGAEIPKRFWCGLEASGAAERLRSLTLPARCWYRWSFMGACPFGVKMAAGLRGGPFTYLRRLRSGVVCPGLKCRG